MTDGQRNYYNSLLESDRMYNKNEAEKYLKKLKKEDQKEIRKLNLKKQQEETYKALLESDEITGRSEAKEYLNKINNKKLKTINIEKEKTSLNLKSDLVLDNINKIAGKTIFSITMIIALLYLIYNLSMGEAIGLSIFVITAFWLVTWFYALITVLINSFEEPMNKIVWFLAIFFIPPTSLLFFFIDDKLIKQK